MGKKPPKKRKSSKGKRKSKKKSSAAAIPVAPPPEVGCKDQIPVDGPCRYNADACCKDAYACRPNSYPGLLAAPQAMAVVGSQCGSYDSLCKLLRAGFRCADRVFMMTPWGNYVAFRASNGANRTYFIFDGCTCNVNRFRYLDLNTGTAGLLYFDEIHNLVQYIIESRHIRNSFKNIRKSVIDDICRNFCEFGK